jgi:hypothetical protein
MLVLHLQVVQTETGFTLCDSTGLTVTEGFKKEFDELKNDSGYSIHNFHVFCIYLCTVKTKSFCYS